MHGYLRHLANFAYVVEARSVSAAAETLGASPSSLSESVRIIEARVGAPLLERRSRGVEPTSEGERIYLIARDIVDGLAKAIGPEEAHGADQHVRISAPAEVAHGPLGVVVRRLQNAAPRLAISIYAEDAVLDASRFGRDYFLRMSSKLKPQQGLREIWRTEVRAALVARTDLVKEDEIDDPAAIAQSTAICSPDAPRPFGYDLSEPAGRLVFERVVQASDATARIALARAGVGATACLDFSVADDLSAGRLIRLVPNRFDVPVSVVLLTPHRRTRAIEPLVVGAFDAAFADIRR